MTLALRAFYRAGGILFQLPCSEAKRRSGYLRPQRHRDWYRRFLTVSHYRGPSEPALLEQTVPAHFESIVNKYGANTAVYSRHQGQRLSYETLNNQSNALARALQKTGVKKGDRVAVSLGNNTEFAILTYSLFKLGAVLVPLNPAFTELQVISALSHLSASMLIIGLETNLSRKPPVSNLGLIRFLLDSSNGMSVPPSLQRLVYVDNVRETGSSRSQLRDIPNAERLINFADLMGSERGGQGPPDPDTPLKTTDVVNIQFTSGTTSTPKAAQLTHLSILNNGASIGDRMLLTAEDNVVCPPPLFHCFGCILGYMATATHGSSIVFPAEAFDPLATLQAVQEERATALYGVPTMFHAMLELIADGSVKYEGFDRLRTGIAAGSSIPGTLMEKLHKILNLTELTICYGMTETSPVSCMTTTNDPMDMRLNSVGRALSHVHLKVVDRQDRSKILPVGERGELVTGGYLVMAGYYGDVERTEEVLVEERDSRGNIVRWMHTGDEAEMTAEGYVKITGRIKDLIIRGGENIHPLEIEDCLLKHPDIFDVSVVGVDDERYGEVVAAFVISKMLGGIARANLQGNYEAIEVVKSFVRSRLSRHLVPKHVFFVDSFPKTASGKVQKFSLREDAKRFLQEAESN